MELVLQEAIKKYNIHQYGTMKRHFQLTPSERVNDFLCKLERPPVLSPLGPDFDIDFDSDARSNDEIFQNEMNKLQLKHSMDKKKTNSPQFTKFSCSDEEKEIMTAFDQMSVTGTDDQNDTSISRYHIELKDGFFIYQSRYESKSVSPGTFNTMFSEVTESLASQNPDIGVTVMAKDILHEGIDEAFSEAMKRGFMRRKIRCFKYDKDPEVLNCHRSHIHKQSRIRKRKQARPTRLVL